jgi:hypothetical protein
VQHSQTIEKMGVPTVAVICDTFKDQCQNTAYETGFPPQRQYNVPMPIAGKSNEYCKQIIDGNDPVTGKPFFQELIDGLTIDGPDDQKTGTIEAPRPTTYGPDTPEKIDQLLQDKKYTDYLPVVLPTLSKVNDMLKGTSHKRDEAIGQMRSTGYWLNRTYTVENIACAAVMAGCKPSYLPVVLALAARKAPAWITSTHSFAACCVINGPIRKEIGLNSGLGALGPFAHANSTIGRAWTILSKCQTNVGYNGKAYMGTTGNSINYNNMCCAEAEEFLPSGWNPLHVQKGFKATDSVVTSVGIWDFVQADPSFEWSLKEQLPNCFRKSQMSQAATAILDPVAAGRLFDEGIKTKEDFSKYVIDNTLIKVKDYWTQSYEIQNFVRPTAMLGQGSMAKYWTADPESMMPYFARTNNISVVVVGGRAQQFWQIASGSPGTPVSIDAWR